LVSLKVASGYSAVSMIRPLKTLVVLPQGLFLSCNKDSDLIAAILLSGVSDGASAS
jgi:hypothetical protein